MNDRVSMFSFSGFAHMRAVLYGEAEGYFYPRDGTPQLSELESSLARLDGFPHVLAFNSGMSAIASVLVSTLSQGDHVLVQRETYGPTRLLFEEYLPSFGIRSTFVDVADLGMFESSILPSTEIVYLELPSSFTLQIPNLDGIRELADVYGLVVVADVSASLGYRQWHGWVDIAIASLSKYVAGDTGLLGGTVFCPETVAQHLEMTRSTLGTTLMPEVAEVFTSQMSMLSQRQHQIRQAAQTFASGLALLEPVVEVMHPTDENGQGMGGLVSAVLDLTPSQLEAFVNNLQHFNLSVTWGGTQPVVTPMLAAYRHEVLSAWGIDQRLVRFYTGSSDPEVLLADVKQALLRVVHNS